MNPVRIRHRQRDGSTAPTAAVETSAAAVSLNQPDPRSVLGQGLQLKVEYRGIDELTRSPRNPRTHSKKQVTKMAASIKQFGFVVPVLVDERSQILAGHGRVEAARQIAMTQIPVIRLDHLTNAEKRAYAIADNRLAELAGWDNEILALELKDLLKIDAFEPEVIRQKQVDVVVIYKVDRLSRSLMDFLKMIEEFDRLGVSVVAITQQFNTTTSMGRLTLNILLSFAQFEREVTTERIRDKIAASKRKGMWMGGNVPLGYDVEHRKLIVNKEEAKTVKLIYRRYLDLGCVRLLQQDLEKQRICSKLRVSQAGKRSGGQSFSRGALYTLLANPVYVGEIRHKSERHEGQHEAILERDLWEKVQQQLKDQGTARKGVTGKSGLSPLAGKLFDEKGNRLVPSHTVKKGRRYRYYVSQQLIKDRAKDVDGAWRLPASEIEATLVAEVTKILSEPATVAKLVARSTNDRNRGEAIQRIQAARARLKADDTRSAALRDIVSRVELRAEALEIEIAVTALLPHLALNDEDAVLRRRTSLAFKLRGVETRLIIGGVERCPVKADPALISLLSRAVGWWESIEMEGASIEHIARHNELSERYLRDILQLAFLAPDIVEAVMRGAQAGGVNRDALMCHPSLPLAWGQQATSFEV